MSGLETGAAIYGLIIGTIEILNAANEAWSAVKDKSGIPKTLRATSVKLAPLIELLKGAETQWQNAKHKSAEQLWVEVGKYVERCNQACKELQEILLKAYPKEDAGNFRRFIKGIGTVLSSKNRTAEQLLKEIHECLVVLFDRQILTNAELLDDIKATVDELLPQSGSTQNNVSGDNIIGDKVVGSKFTGGSGPMFNAPINTYNAGGK